MVSFILTVIVLVYFRRKRGEKGEREVVETPAVQIVRKLTIERIEELKELIQNEQKKYK